MIFTRREQTKQTPTDFGIANDQIVSETRSEIEQSAPGIDKEVNERRSRWVPILQDGVQVSIYPPNENPIEEDKCQIQRVLVHLSLVRTL